jgi:hypothetical protein
MNIISAKVLCSYPFLALIVALVALVTTALLCLQILADKIIQQMKFKEGSSFYNGIHMRMEKDASDWAIIMGGRQRLWQLYKEAMQNGKLDHETPLYVASGLLKASADDTWSRDEMQRLTTDIVDSKVLALLLCTVQPITLNSLRTGLLV